MHLTASASVNIVGFRPTWAYTVQPHIALVGRKMEHQGLRKILLEELSSLASRTHSAIRPICDICPGIRNRFATLSFNLKS